MKTKLLALLLVLLMVLSVVPTFADTHSFTDIKGHWAEGDIVSLYGKGIVNGKSTTSFDPNGLVKIDEFVKLCVTQLGYIYDTSSYGYWATPYLKKASELGLITENEYENYFDRAISREQMATIAVRTLRQKEVLGASELDREIVKDVHDYYIVQDYRKQDVLDAYRVGLIQGKGANKFDPKGYATRAESTVVIQRLITKDRRVAYKPKVDIPSFEVVQRVMNDYGRYESQNITLYAPKNYLGEYETEAFLFHQYSLDTIKTSDKERNVYTLEMYNPLGYNIATGMYVSPDAEFLTGYDKADLMVASISSKFMDFQQNKGYATDYTFFMWRSNLPQDITDHQKYLMDNWGELIVKWVDLLAESESEMILAKVKNAMNNNTLHFSEVKDEVIKLKNGRLFTISSDMSGFAVRFSEKGGF